MQLQRDELIMSMSDIVKRIVRKYNNNRYDEDLYQTGMMACISGIDICLERKIEDIEIMKAMCAVCSRNRILNYLRDNRYYDKHIYDECDAEDFIFGKVEERTGDIDLEVDIYNNMDAKTYEIYRLSLEGYTPEEIGKKINLSVGRVYHYLDKLKYFIYDHKHA